MLARTIVAREPLPNIAVPSASLSLADNLSFAEAAMPGGRGRRGHTPFLWRSFSQTARSCSRRGNDRTPVLQALHVRVLPGIRSGHRTSRDSNLHKKSVRHGVVADAGLMSRYCSLPRRRYRRGG